MRPPTEAEHRRLHELFSDLCRIPSPSGEEAACAALVRDRLGGMGVSADQDEAGNLLARIVARASSDRCILLCAHLDTVAVDGPIEPVQVDGGWVNVNDAILGADNKAAVAVILAAAERCVAEGSPVGLELLFTVREEDALAGVKAFDASALRSDWGYVFDHATPIGEVVVASPTSFRLRASFRGAAAHAGIRPEDGRSAIVAAARAIAALRLGRLDPETTANVGSVSGGVAGTNVVPEHCSFQAEVRSLDDDRADAVVAEMVDAIHEAANAHDVECDADVHVQRVFGGYRHRRDAPQVLAAEAALRASGYEPERIVSGGASDANVLVAAGLRCANLANGTERNHEPTERVSFAALEGMLAVTYALLDACAEAQPAGSLPASGAGAADG